MSPTRAAPCALASIRLAWRRDRWCAPPTGTRLPTTATGIGSRSTTPTASRSARRGCGSAGSRLTGASSSTSSCATIRGSLPPRRTPSFAAGPTGRTHSSGTSSGQRPSAAAFRPPPTMTQPRCRSPSPAPEAMTTRRTTAGRRPAASRPAFKRSTYEEDVERFLAEREEETYQCYAGLRDQLALAGIYERHAQLFSRRSIDALRKLTNAGGADAARHRALLAFAADGFIDQGVSALTDAIATAEAKAIVIWRGERLPYRAVRGRISQIDGRAERNAL